MSDQIRILLIDDDDVDRMAFKRSVSKTDLNALVTAVDEPLAGLKLIEENFYDIIYVDYMLPGGYNGFDVFTEIRKRNAEVPVVIVTSHGDERLAVEMLRAGVVDYIPKSMVTPDGLVQGIRHIMRLKEAQIARKVAEEQLRNSEEKYRHIVENASDIIYNIDPAGYITFVNKVTERICGYSAEQLIGRRIREFVFEEDIREVAEFYRNQLLHKIPNTYKEFRIVTRTGEALWIGQNLELIVSGDEVISCTAVARNITERKKIEAQLIQAKKFAEETSLLKEQFLANMSHEIRTPLNAIIGFTELLLKSDLKHEQEDQLKIIHNSGENLLILINDILDFSKIEAGKIEFEEIEFDPASVLRNAAELIRIKAVEKNIDLQLSIADAIPRTVSGDPYRLNQIILNLLSNAVKFTNHGSVQLKAVFELLEEGMILMKVEVKDTGIGIPQEKLQNIFNSFSQASNETTRKYGGSGLGLTIAKSLAELQGGEINVQSIVGKGSSFIVTIPYRTNRVSSKSNEQDLKEFVIPQHIKVLLAEDNVINQKLFRKVLKNNNVNNVDVADNGKIAVELLNMNNYNILFLDLQMPEMDGISTARYIRNNFSDEIKKNIPIVAITAHAFKEEKDKCIEAGMNDFISKPFKEADLLNILKKYTSAETSNFNQDNTINQSEKITDLSYLKKLAQGDNDFVKDMLETFINQRDSFISEMSDALNDGRYEDLSGIAHKMKSSLSIIHLKELEPVIKAIETKALHERKDAELKSLIADADSITYKACIELTSELKAL